MDHVKAIRLGLKLGVAGIALVVLAWRKWKFQRRFANEQSISIASAPQGAVQLSGKAWAEKPMENLEGEKVAYLAWAIEKRTWGYARHWRTLHERARNTTLTLHDESGVVRIDTEGGRISLAKKTRPWNSLNLAQKSVVAEWVKRSEFALEAVKLPFLYRVTTQELTEGAQVTVCGYLETHGYNEIMRVANSGYHEAPSNLTHGILRTDANCELHIANADKARVISSLSKWIKLQLILGAIMIAAGAVCVGWGFLENEF